MKQYTRVLRENPNYARLWFAQVISLLGDWFNTIALSVLVAQYSNGSGIAISLFLVARFMPMLILGPFAGVLVDRFNRKMILVTCNALRAFVVLGFLLVNTPDRLWMIYALTLAQFSLSALFEPAQSAILPALVKQEHLVIANTLSSVTWSAMLALGAIVGGLVSALFGIQAALIIDALTFAFAGVLTRTIQLEHPERLTEVHHEDNGSLRDGVRYVRRHPATAAVLSVKGLTHIGNVDTIMTFIGTGVFVLNDNPQLSLGILYSVYGLGAIAGPVILNRFNDESIPRMRALILIGFVWATLGWFLLSSLVSLWLAAIAVGIRAMGGSANWTYSSVIVQKSVPNRYLGRVFSLDLAFFQLLMVASTLGHGAIIDLLNRGVHKPLLAMQNAPMFNDLANVLNRAAIAHNLSMVSFFTGLLMVLPTLYWMLVLPRIKSQEAVPASALAG